MPESRHDPDLIEDVRPLGEHDLLLAHDERTPVHVHARGHLVYPATGVLSLATSTGSWIAPSNRVVWIPADFEHQHRAHGRTDMRIVFLPPSLGMLLPPHPAVLAMTPLAREATMVLTGAQPRSPGTRARLRRVLIDEVTIAAEQPLHLPDPRDDRLRALADLAEKTMEDSPTLTQLGRQIGASKRTLSRLFRHETGMSFPQWRTQLRVHHALVLLADGVTVVNAATACGWANPSAFIESFAALVGQTPGRYQRSLREDMKPTR